MHLPHSWTQSLLVYTSLIIYNAFEAGVVASPVLGSYNKPDRLYALSPPSPMQDSSDASVQNIRPYPPYRDRPSTVNPPMQIYKLDTAPLRDSSAQAASAKQKHSPQRNPSRSRHPTINPPMQMYNHRHNDDYELDYHTNSHAVQCFNSLLPDAGCCNDVGCAADSGPRDVHLRCKALDLKTVGEGAPLQFCIREGYQ